MPEYFDNETGATHQTLFGCTVRSISAEYSKNDTSATCQVTLIKESGQTFFFETSDMPSDGVKAVVNIAFGEFAFVGVVTEWEKTIISRTGRDIYVVKLNDARHILNEIEVVLGTSGPVATLVTPQDKTFGGMPKSPTPSTNPGGSSSPGGGTHGSVPKWLTDLVTVAGPYAGGVINAYNQGSVPSSWRGNYNVVAVEPDDPIDHGKGMNWSKIKEAIEDAELIYGLCLYQIKLTELDSYIEAYGTGESSEALQRIKGKKYMMGELLNLVCEAFSLSWYVEMTTDGGINYITIRVHTDSVVGNETTRTLSLQDLADLHEDEVFTMKQGTTFVTKAASKLVLSGPPKKTLTEYGSSSIKPFWGFQPGGGDVQWGNLSGRTIKGSILPPGAEDGFVRVAYVPLTEPSFHVPGEPDEQLHSASIADMRALLRGTTTDNIKNWSIEKQNALRQYAKANWGKKFYIELPADSFKVVPPNSQYSDDYKVEQWVTSSPVGWWEGATLPEDFDEQATAKLCQTDGRWMTFVKMPKLAEPITEPIGGGDEITVYTEQWDNLMQKSENVVLQDDEYYMKCRVETFDNYLVLTLPDALVTRNSENQRSRETELAGAWIPLQDTRESYGPWTSDDYLSGGEVQAGSSDIKSDTTLAPWSYGYAGMLHSEAEAKLQEAVQAKLAAWKPTQGNISTGQLEVAGLPVVNLGTLIGVGGARIDNMSVQYGADGVTTRYNVNRKTQKDKEQEDKDKKKDDKANEKTNDQDPGNDLKELQDKVKALEEALQGGGLGGSSTGSGDEVNPDDEEGAALDLDLTGFDPDDFEQDPDTYGEVLQHVMEYKYKRKKRKRLPLDKPDGGMGYVLSSDGGPFYNIKRLDARDIDPGIASDLNLDNMMWAPAWTGVRNLSEPIESPGYLQPLTRVTVKMFVTTYTVYTDEALDGTNSTVPIQVARYTPYLEHTPPVFAPPVAE